MGNFKLNSQLDLQCAPTLLFSSPLLPPPNKRCPPADTFLLNHQPLMELMLTSSTTPPSSTMRTLSTRTEISSTTPQTPVTSTARESSHPSISATLHSIEQRLEASARLRESSRNISQDRMKPTLFLVESPMRRSGMKSLTTSKTPQKSPRNTAGLAHFLTIDGAPESPIHAWALST